MSYVELHCHSAFSFLDGVSLPEELVATAADYGYEALALTDHNSVSGSMEFARMAKASRLHAIHGAELDLDGGRHLTLLVETQKGWSNLCRLLTLAHAHTRDDRPAQPADPQVSLADVLDHAEGLIALSGCYSRGIHDEPTLRRLRDGFTPANLRVELQRPYLQDDRARNRGLQRLAERLELKTVATGNVHAHARARAPLQDALVALRLHTTLDASEPERRGNFSHVLAAPAAMAARFPEFPHAIRETELLAERLSFDLTNDLGYRYPGSEDPTKRRYLAELCSQRLHELYEHSPFHIRVKAQVRLEQELAIIEQLNLAGFFVLHHQMLELAREVAAEVRTHARVAAPAGAATIQDSPRSWLPPGRGRGSSVSSIICYLTGLSHIDPVTNDLSIGRFLSEDLQALPDIDLDFPRDIREVLIPRVHERFGRDRSALVAAFPTFRARGAIRELGKVLGLPPAELERLARNSEMWDARGVGQDIQSTFGAHSDTRYTRGRWAWLARLAEQAHGLPRHLSQHSGGMVIATRSLIDCCPIVPAAMEGRQIVQWDKDSCADARFLKIDLLGLGMLSAVERCVELIAHTRGTRVDLSRIPLDDRKTYDAIQAADTMGVFQIESRAQMQSLLRTQPRTLKEIAIQVAIVRPGPIQGGAVNPYIQRLQRLRVDPDYEIPYEHPALEEALKETLGAIIFQDQVLEVAIAFSDFRPGEAEDLRRAMSRKRSEAAIEAHRQRFVDGAIAKHGVSEEIAQQVFEKVKGFAGFGFPKAHAAAFGLLAYQSTWLRVHYGPEFLCALLNEQPMGFYPPDALVHEAQRRGINVLAPDVNLSGIECELGQDGSVRIGLGYIRGVRREQIQWLVCERLRGGPFRDLSDLASRVGAGHETLELLAWSGACDPLITSPQHGSVRRLVLWQLGVATPGVRRTGGVQLTLPLDLPQAPRLRELSGWESLLADYGTAGLTTKAHPIQLLRPRLPTGCVDSRQLVNLRHGTRVRIAGLVVARQRPGTAGGVVFVLLEDEHGAINLVIPPAIYERHRLEIRSEPLLLACGKLEKLPAAGGATNVLVTRVSGLDAPGGLVARVQDFSPMDERVLAEERIAAGQRTERDTASDDFRAVAPAVMSFAQGRRR